MKRLDPQRRELIAAALCEGNSVRATARLTGAAFTTVLLEKSQYQISGRSTGLQAGWGWIVGAGGLLFTAIGAFAALVLRH